jgi:CTP synthase
MRLGAQIAKLAPGSHAAACYGTEKISERHRHRYEFNNRYRQQFAANGMLVAGTSLDDSLVEIIELPSQRWFVAVQYHPEFQSKPTAAHPLFAGFIAASVEHRAAKLERSADAPAEASAPAPKSKKQGTSPTH